MVYLVLKPNTLVVKGINTSELHIIHSSPPKSCSSYNFWVFEVYIKQQSLPIYHAWHSVILSQYFRHTLVIQRYTCIQSSLFCPLAFFLFVFVHYINILQFYIIIWQPLKCDGVILPQASHIWITLTVGNCIFQCSE